MKLPPKHTRIAILLVTSQLLLSGFALYWLNSQYRQEKILLWGELKGEYRNSELVVIDSMLMRDVINPALGDSIFRFRGHASGMTRVIMADSAGITVAGRPPEEETGSQEALVTIMLKSADDSIIDGTEQEMERLDNELLLRSVRLIVNSSDNRLLNEHIASVHGSEPGIDSALFISDFEARLNEYGAGFDAIWIDGATDYNIPAAKQKEIFLGGMQDIMPDVIIKSYRPYLLRQILPQLLFALVLIIITGSASFVAYKSMRQQMILNDMRNTFISNISHELKTPVSTVKVALEAVRNFELALDPAESREYLEMAAKEIKRLELLITKVLDNSILEKDSSIVKFERVDLVSLVKGAVDSLRPRIDESKAKVTVNDPGSLVVDADPLYLQGVLINLFDNSLKYGNGNTEISVVIKSNNGNAVIIVSDNGPGIPEQYLNRVFEKFFRVPANDTHNVKGYGLGLSFAALIIRMHNGTIRAVNNKTGCSFIITIPEKRV
jgi:two-component system phosphate regulon sensor histidine kinase PhoR